MYNRYYPQYNSYETSFIERFFLIKYVENSEVIKSRFDNVYVSLPIIKVFEDYLIDSNKKYVDIIYIQQIPDEQYDYIDVNFITNDIENIFGKIINENEFKKSLNSFLTSPNSHHNDYNVFKTESNCSVIFALSEDGSSLQFYCAALLELEDGVNEQNFTIVMPSPKQ
jgi:hypothetical protein